MKTTTLLSMLVLILIVSGCEVEETQINLDREVTPIPVSKAGKESKEIKIAEGVQQQIDEKISTDILEPDINSPTEKFLNFLEAIFSEFATISKESYTLIDQYSSKELTKEKLCDEINIKRSSFNKLNDKLDELKLRENLLLKERVIELKELLLNIGKNRLDYSFDKIETYCNEGSVIELSKADEKLNNLAGNYLIYHEQGGRTQNPNERVSSEEMFSVKIEEIRNMLKTETTDLKVYGIGDTIKRKIEGFDRELTLKEVKKDYAHILFSYDANDKTWSKEEWSDIRKYRISWANTYDKELQNQIVEELNNKYSSKLSEWRKFQYFNYVHNIPFSFKEMGTSILYIPSKDKFIEEEYDINFGYIQGLFYLEPEERNEKVKLIISYEGCGKNKEEIKSAEKGEICPLTFIFNVDLAEVKYYV
ncbi:hypothetical protein KY366_03775 [Candidatus Woesearchaeota archaeon]|nr:hypothetical protein [Candidatus Woesearchaeota archaeon]